MLDHTMEAFKIYIDRLKGGQTVQIQGSYDPFFLHVAEPDLLFQKPVNLFAESYLTDDHLIVHITTSTVAKMPCAICNEMIETPISVKDFYHTEPLSEIQSAIFDISEPVREALLLELPHIVECNQGHCAAREIIKPFMRPEQNLTKKDYFPFSNIDINN